MKNQLEQMVQKALARRYGKAVPEPVRRRCDEELRLLNWLDIWREIAALSDLAAHLRARGARYRVTGAAPGLFLLWLLGAARTNPLPPHYYCCGCGAYEEADAPDGFDLPEKRCACGSAMLADGHGIPLEIFCDFLLWEEDEWMTITILLPEGQASLDFLFAHPLLGHMPMVSTGERVQIGALRLRLFSPAHVDDCIPPPRSGAKTPAEIREYTLSHWEELTEGESARAPATFFDALRLFGMREKMRCNIWPYSGEGAWPLTHLIAFVDELYALLRKHGAPGKAARKAMLRIMNHEDGRDAFSVLPPECAWAIVCKKKGSFSYKAEATEALLQLVSAPDPCV